MASDNRKEATSSDQYPQFRRESDRLVMVDEQIRKRGITDERVLAAMERVPRHLFVPPEAAEQAYEDYPLPIGMEQTISQPYIVALMTEALALEPTDRVLEIGTGSGYQTAILAELAKEVYSIEVVDALGQTARARLETLEYKNIQVRVGDGYRGWPEAAPFDAIIVTAAPQEIPRGLVDQLADAGRMVVPVGLYYQDLYLIEKKGREVTHKKIAAVRFVPMVEGGGE